MSVAERRADVLQKVKELTARLNDSEERLVSTRKRVAEMTGKNAAMSAQLASFDSTIASFKTIVDNQKVEIANLNQRVDALTSENSQLKVDNVHLVADKSQLTNERNTVYYVIGTKEGLLQQHIIEQTGGMLGIGKVPVPARELSPSAFTSIDKTMVSEIPFPKANTPYRVITRQDLSALETAPDKHGVVVNALKIKDPDAFWAASRYLIVVER
jgi:regulator of replication initiation timing